MKHERNTNRTSEKSRRFERALPCRRSGGIDRGFVVETIVAGQTIERVRFAVECRARLIARLRRPFDFGVGHFGLRTVDGIGIEIDGETLGYALALYGRIAQERELVLGPGSHRRFGLQWS